MAIFFLHTLSVANSLPPASINTNDFNLDIADALKDLDKKVEICDEIEGNYKRCSDKKIFRKIIDDDTPSVTFSDFICQLKGLPPGVMTTSIRL